MLKCYVGGVVSFNPPDDQVLTPRVFFSLMVLNPDGTVATTTESGGGFLGTTGVALTSTSTLTSMRSEIQQAVHDFYGAASIQFVFLDDKGLL